MKFLRIALPLLLIASACHQNASQQILYKTNLQDYENRPLHFGDHIDLQVSGVGYDSIVVMMNGKRQETSFSLDSSNGQIGLNNLKTIIYHQGEKTERTAALDIFPEEPPRRLNFKIVKTWPHNADNFTEGFFYENGKIYEGTGLNNASGIQVYTLGSTKIIQQKALDGKYFGEGIARVGDTLYQLTYKAQKVFLYKAASLDPIGSFNCTFSAEGWGLCYNGQELVMTNGTDRLFFIDPKNFSLKRSVEVLDNARHYNNLNEVEWIDGHIYANVWYSNDLLMINPANGVVEAIISLENIPAENTAAGVTNGIAAKDGHLLVTGKNWPNIFEMEKSTPSL